MTASGSISSLIVIGLAGSLLGACSGHDTRSRTASFFGETNGYFVDPAAAAGLSVSNSVGALAAEIDGRYQFFCSAIHIAPQSIMTNHHCSEILVDNPGLQIFFYKNYRASKRDAGQINFVVSGNGALEPSFSGTLAAPIVPEDMIEVDFSHPKLDLISGVGNFDVYVAPLKKATPGFLSAKPIREASELILISFPGGLPQFSSTDCRVVGGDGPTTVYHDCDSFGGSSAGLLVDAQSLRPFAIHKAGLNEKFTSEDSNFYKLNHRMMTREEHAAAYCNAQRFHPADCPAVYLRDHMHNFATPLVDIPGINWDTILLDGEAPGNEN